MPTPSYSIVFSAQLASTADSVAVGTAVIRSGTSYVVATSANRGSAKSEGIALTAADSNTPGFEILSVGTVDATTAGLAAGSASWVRVSSTGTLERCTPSGSDDICGYCEADGTFHALFGILTPTLVNGGGVSAPVSLANGGFGADVSASTGIPKVAAGSFSFVTAPSGDIVGRTDTQTLTNKTIDGASNTLTVRLANDVSGTLPMANGGLGSNISASSGIPSVSAGSLSFKTTPSGDIVGHSDSQTLTNKTLTSPTLGGTPVYSATSVQATGNARAKVYSDIASVQTTDATATSAFTWTITDEAVTVVTVEACAVKSDGTATASYVRRVRIKRDGGTVTVGTVESTFTDEEAGFSTCDVTIDNSGSTGRVRVTGVLVTTIDWGVVVTRLEVTHA